ncbi:hypothetical protein GM415_08750 [Pseudodesulfovibrio cashew]|uniref:Uncharacterized protein n=1 Tax=Pseudodesulfovibrio cashew TaxID=2678688 RepID=A0A6I6JIS1_9BACT|nr:hypothetical protein [Pseudodesulfovibrio cashew]QGY40212.1 hypothetical protein GM415_08750 [Pseudodesulfovibrio cashew]
MMRRKVLEKIRKLHTFNAALKDVARGTDPLDMPHHLEDAAYLLQAECLDLSEHLTHYIGSRIYRQDSRDGHPNSKGSRIIADHLAGRVRAMLSDCGGRNLYPLY